MRSVWVPDTEVEVEDDESQEYDKDINLVSDLVDLFLVPGFVAHANDSS
jgi:hypothetical protein